MYFIVIISNSLTVVNKRDIPHVNALHLYPMIKDSRFLPHISHVTLTPKNIVPVVTVQEY